MPGIRPYVGPMLCPARPWRPNPRLLVIGTLLAAGALLPILGSIKHFLT